MAVRRGVQNWKVGRTGTASNHRRSIPLKKATFLRGFCSVVNGAICIRAMQVPSSEAPEIGRRRKRTGEPGNRVMRVEEL